jgi:putative tributyrin esterase
MAFLNFHYFSNALNKQTSAYVLLPETGEGPFPVLYLLHGYSDDHTIWLRRTSIERYVSELGIIVVMPDGGHGFYADAVEGYAFGTAIGKELVERMDRTFPTQANREGRVIAGLSMGGYGSVRLALAYPETFRAAHSLSGAMGYGHKAPNWNNGRNGEFLRVVGEDFVGGPCDLYALAEKNHAAGTLPKLRIDCGTEDFLIEDNREFAKFLTEKAIPHEYEEFPGAHTWEYWDEHIQDALKFFFPKL